MASPPSQPLSHGLASTFGLNPQFLRPTSEAKKLQPISPHTINQVWEPTIASAIEVYLEDKQVQCTSVDPVHIGYAGSKDFPVVIWVDVIPNSLPVEKSLSIALGCHRILVENGNCDVHIEICQSTTTLHAILYKPVHTINTTVQAIEPFATSLGLPICGADSTNFEGTGGFFFTDTNHPSKPFLITARPVLFNPNHTPNKHYKKQSNSQTAKNVLLLGNAILKKRIDSIQSKIGGKEIIGMQLLARLQNVEGQDNKAKKE